MPDRLDDLRRELARPHDHPDADTLREYGGQVLDWLLNHFRTLPEQPIGRPASRRELNATLGGPPPERGREFAEVLGQFGADVAPYSFRVNHPRFLAFIPSAPNFVSAIGDFLCAGTNFFCGVWLEASGPTQIELTVLDWFNGLFGLPREANGILTSGGSEANLTALVVARERLRPADRARAVLYVTDQRHWSVDRAAKVMALAPEQVRPVSSDRHYRMRPEALLGAVEKDRVAGRLPWVVVANAGATNTGAVDKLDAVASIAHEAGLWFHVDAAYGWPVVLVPDERDALRGIEQADSITLDPHKWFGQPFEAGCVLVREGRRLQETFALRPDYMQDVEPGQEEVNFADMGIALTRRFRALKIWLSVQVLGLDWFRSMVGRCCRLADFAEELLRRQPHITLLSARQLSIVCFRYVPEGLEPGPAADEAELDRINLAIVERVRQTGRAFFSSTKLRTCVALRFCFVNWRTTAGDVEEVVRLLTEAGAGLANEKAGRDR